MAVSELLHIIFPENNFYQGDGRLIKKYFHYFRFILLNTN